MPTIKVSPQISQAFATKAGQALAKAKNLKSVEEFSAYLAEKGTVLRQALRDALQEGQQAIDQTKGSLRSHIDPMTAPQREAYSTKEVASRGPEDVEAVKLEKTLKEPVEEDSVFNKLRNFLNKSKASDETVNPKLTPADISDMLKESSEMRSRFEQAASRKKGLK